LTARRLFDRFEPVHALTYFAPEALAAFDAVGFRGFWMGYFAGRSAPLGPVPVEVVTAIFYNFSASHVGRALPAAWGFASPGDALRIRERSAVAALRRCGVTGGADVETAAHLLAKAARSAPLDGRPMFAPTWRCRGPTNRLPRCGMRRRCFANIEVTPTLRC
jgi:hypothetical protein